MIFSKILNGINWNKRFLILISIYVFTGCKSEPPKMIYPEVKAEKVEENLGKNPQKSGHELTDIEKAFEDLKSFYETYAINWTDMVLIQNGKFRGYLMVGQTGIPLKAVTAHYNLGSKDGLDMDEVGFLCYNDIPCIDDIDAQKSYPGVYFYFNSKESCLRFIQKFEALKALL